MEIEEEIHHFAVLGKGGVKGHQNCEQTFCEQTGVSYSRRRAGMSFGISELLYCPFP